MEPIWSDFALLCMGKSDSEWTFSQPPSCVYGMVQSTALLPAIVTVYVQLLGSLIRQQGLCYLQ